MERIYNVKFYSFYSRSVVVRIIKSWRLRWLGYVAYMDGHIHMSNVDLRISSKNITLKTKGSIFRRAYCPIIRAMKEAANTSNTSVNFYNTTRCNIPNDRHTHTRRPWEHEISWSISCLRHAFHVLMSNLLILGLIIPTTLTIANPWWQKYTAVIGTYSPLCLRLQ